MQFLLCDDHPLVVEAIAALLKILDPQAEIKSAGDRSGLLALVREHADASLCILDLHMPGTTITSLLPELKTAAPKLPVFILTADETDEALLDALKHNIAGFAHKSAQPDVLVAAIQLVLAGGRYLPYRAAEIALTSRGRTTSREPNTVPGSAGMSNRQQEVLRLLCAGLSTKAIARQLGLSPATVKSHTSQILAALGASNRMEASVRARASGFI